MMASNFPMSQQHQEHQEQQSGGELAPTVASARERALKRSILDNVEMIKRMFETEQQIQRALDEASEARTRLERENRSLMTENASLRERIEVVEYLVLQQEDMEQQQHQAAGGQSIDVPGYGATGLLGTGKAADSASATRGVAAAGDVGSAGDRLAEQHSGFVPSAKQTRAVMQELAFLRKQNEMLSDELAAAKAREVVIQARSGVDDAAARSRAMPAWAEDVQGGRARRKKPQRRQRSHTARRKPQPRSASDVPRSALGHLSVTELRDLLGGSR